MTDILSNVHVVMQNAGYRTWDTSGAQTPTVGFEDEATMGFVCVFSDPAALMAGWRTTEAALLNRHASNFKLAGDKAWNVYSVFITEQRATDNERRKIRWIEEDLEQTRKITATGVVAREGVALALLPLLPIVSKAVLIPEDLTQRLERRIEMIAPRVGKLALDIRASPLDVARRLRGEP